jgi:hypothetical protein
LNSVTVLTVCSLGGSKQTVKTVTAVLGLGAHRDDSRG